MCRRCARSCNTRGFRAGNHTQSQNKRRSHAILQQNSVAAFFCGCPCLSETESLGAHSICARGGLSCRKRARADMESAPTFFVAGGVPSQRRCPAWSCLPLLKARSVGAHSICARGGLSYRKRARADMESAPTFFCRGGQGVRFCLLCVQADLFPLAPCQKPSYVVYYFSTSPQANPVQTGDAKL